MEVGNPITQGDFGILSNALSFVRNGAFYWYDGNLNKRDTIGFYWTSHTYNKVASYRLVFNNSAFTPQNANIKGNGFAIRCMQKFIKFRHQSICLYHHKWQYARLHLSKRMGITN